MVSVNTHRPWEEKQILERRRNDDAKTRPDVPVCRGGLVVSRPASEPTILTIPRPSDSPQPQFPHVHTTSLTRPIGSVNNGRPVTFL